MFKFRFFVDRFDVLCNRLGSHLIKIRDGRLGQPQRFLLKASFNAHFAIIAGKHNKLTCR